MLLESFWLRRHAELPLGALILFCLYLTSLYSYLLFHTLAEIFSIVIAFSIFVIAWNTRRISGNKYFLFLGISYLFIGGIDLIHTLAYKGLEIFQGYDANLPTQLWISARYLESISLFVAVFIIGKEIDHRYVFISYITVTALLFSFIFYFNVFPDCYIEGEGLTPFKKYSEYLIVLILLSTTALMIYKREAFDKNVLNLLILALVSTMLAELAFTFYIDVYDFSNLVGHIFKIISFYLIYKAIIQTSLLTPYDFLFRDLKLSEEQFRDIFTQSPIGILLCDSQGVLIEANNAFLGIFGVSEGESNQRINLFDDPNLANVIKAMLSESKPTRTQFAYDFEKIKELGLYSTEKTGKRNIDIMITPISLKGQESNPGYLLQVQDITDWKQAEQQLKQQKEELSEFAHTMNHDLQNRLHSILGYTRLLQTKNDPTYASKIDLLVKDASELLRRSVRLADAGFVVQKTDYIDLNRLIQAIAKETIPENINFHSEKLPSILGDRFKIGQVFQNLFINATTHATPTEIRIHFQRSDEDVHILITNNGIPIAENDRMRIFEEGFTTKEVGGGLGLNIVQKVLRAHNWQISLDNTEETTFRITIPAKDCLFTI
ncbi:MAG: MASE3 domain-containing protein [Candidatus Hodarchaeota archaeon]